MRPVVCTRETYKSPGEGGLGRLLRENIFVLDSQWRAHRRLVLGRACSTRPRDRSQINSILMPPSPTQRYFTGAVAEGCQDKCEMMSRVGWVSGELRYHVFPDRMYKGSRRAQDAHHAPVLHRPEPLRDFGRLRRDLGGSLLGTGRQGCVVVPLPVR